MRKSHLFTADVRKAMKSRSSAESKKSACAVATLLIVEADPATARSIERACSHTLCSTVAHSSTMGRALWTGADGYIVSRSLPDGCGFDLLAHIRDCGSAKPAMILVGANELNGANRAFDLGAYYCEKPIEAKRLARFADEVALLRQGAIERAVHIWGSHHNLTQAEQQVLSLAIAGHTYDQIALVRGVTRETLKYQIKTLLRKTGDATLIYAALRCFREAAALLRPSARR